MPKRLGWCTVSIAMIRDRSTSRVRSRFQAFGAAGTRPRGPAATALVLGAALLGTAVIGGAVLAGCTSDPDRSSPSTSPPGTSGSGWSAVTPDSTSTGTAGTAPAPATSGGTAGTGGTAGGTAGPGGTAGGGGGPASQPSAEASRDGVAPSVAVLPQPDRVRQVPREAGGGATRSTADDGIWMISRPAGAPEGDAELLHLDRSGSRILRAYPFPSLGPQWLTVTSKAVYCGRRGIASAPDAMVCRVDRATGDLRVRVIADRAEETQVTEEQVAGRPGIWTVDDRNFLVDLGLPPTLGTELTFRSNDAVLRLSPDTLGVLGS